jgi:hypothetical protein
LGTWRYSVGHRGISRVTVFERHDAHAIYVEWWDDAGRHKRALKTITGHPVTDRELAREIAGAMSRGQERKRNQQAADMLGIPADRTLRDLLDRRHGDLKESWTPKYKRSRDLRRKFWLDKLGDVRLTSVNAAIVERIAKQAQGKKSDRWRQDVLRYLVDSFIYAERKLKWIEPKHNLSAVTIPRARGVSVAYSLEEARRLVPALWEVHPVAGWIGTVLAQTGRRLSAVRTLTPEHVTRAGRWTVIHFPGETDKARNTGEAAVFDLPERTDWTVPAEEACNDWLHAAEEAAGIEHVQRRAYHGLKRLYATLTTNLPGADRQSGTRRETLEGHYRQDILAPKKKVAKVLARKLGGA